MEPEQSKSSPPEKESTVEASAADPSQPAPTEAADTDTGETEAPTKVASPPSTGRATAVFALLLSLLALAAAGYTGYLYYERQQPLNAELETTVKGVQSDARQLEEKRAALQKEIGSLQQQLKEAQDVQGTLRSAVDKIVNDLGRNRNDWVLAETQQLLLIANYRLQLAGDVQTAVAALRVADRRLEQLADPALLPIRKLIAEEITQLQALDRADVPGIALQLGTLAKASSDWPLDTDRVFRPVTTTTATPLPPENEAAVWKYLREIWHDLLSLVRIRVSTDVQKPLLLPEQSYFLRENLRLMLYSAQLAALQGDTATYKQNIETADSWIKDYFDADSQAVISARQELERLANEKILIQPPDISASLNALRAFMQKQGQG
jgi:uroporphyrin-3 C-methyltransferase